MNQATPTTITTAGTERLRRNAVLLTGAGQAVSHSFWTAWRWWLPPALVGLALVLYFVDPFIGDWDGMDYTMLAVAGYPSSMALGRNLFIFGNHALFEIAHQLFHVPPADAYLIFKYAVVAQTPFAVVSCWILARDLSGSIYSASLAAICVALSPVFILYGGQVMTDVPSVLLLSIALIIHLRGVVQDRAWLVVVGAALLGLGVNLRETVGFFAPWLVLAPLLLKGRPGRREFSYVIITGVVFLLCALGWFSYWFVTDAHYRWTWFGWRESMAQESGRHPVTIKNLWPYFMYFFITSPLVFVSLPFAIWKEWARRRMTPLLLLGLVGLFSNILLFFNYSTAVNWRYFLTGLPAIAPLSSDFLIRKLSTRMNGPRRAFVSCAVAVVVLAFVFGILTRPVSQEFVQRRALSKEYRNALANVPRDAVMISGAQTIAVTYWKSMGLGEWKTIGTGGGWPGNDLVPDIQSYLQSGKRVFLDADPRWWLPCGWQRDEIGPIVSLEKQFAFHRVTETIYELRPLGDPSAKDSPDLSRLLPVNRPNDTKKCSLRGV